MDAFPRRTRGRASKAYRDYEATSSFSPVLRWRPGFSQWRWGEHPCRAEGNSEPVSEVQVMQRHGTSSESIRVCACNVQQTLNWSANDVKPVCCPYSKKRMLGTQRDVRTCVSLEKTLSHTHHSSTLSIFNTSTNINSYRATASNLDSNQAYSKKTKPSLGSKGQHSREGLIFWI